MERRAGALGDAVTLSHVGGARFAAQQSHGEEERQHGDDEQVKQKDVFVVSARVM